MNPMLWKDCSTLRKLMLMKAIAGGASGSECTATGNPAFFAANTTRNMKISVPTAQEGTPAKIFVSGTNVWDEQYINGLIESDGSTGTASTRIMSKNYIPVVAGKKYMMVWPVGLNRGRGAYYDASYNLVEYKSDFPDNSDDNGIVCFGTFTVPAGACYVKFCTNASYGSTYGNNISLNYPAIDLEYHAYSGQEYDVTLPATNIPAKNGNNVVTCSLNADMQVKFYCDNPKEDKLVVMTYNVQAFTGLNADKDMQNDIIEEYEPSIIGMQEVGQRYYPSKIKDYITSAYWGLYGGEQPQKTAIASTYGLSNVQYHDFTNNGSEAKGYQTAEIKFKGKNIFLVNLHTISSASAVTTAQQCQELLNLVSTKETFILIGDFNTDVQSASDSMYTSCLKPFVDAGYKLANCSTAGFIGTWTSGKTEEGTWYCDDNIICSADLAISNVRRDTIKITEAGVQDKQIDHVALICDIDIA